MKKTLLLLLSLSLLTPAFFAKTVTDINLSNAPYANGATENEYGDKIMYQDVTINTNNFKINNYWGNYSDTAQNQSNFSNIATSATVKLTTSSTSACTLESGLEKEGCSGQKPFIINNEVLNNPMPGTTDKYQIAFTEAKNYTNNDYNGFYPLDILRNAAYYKKPTDENTTTVTNKKSFFSYITGSIDYLFNKVVGVSFFGQKDIADIQEDVRSNAAQDRRQRYIANIIAGIDKDDRLTKSIADTTATTINPTLNTPVSLLHYAEAKKVTTAAQCEFASLQLSPDGALCRVMTGFGMNAWMPFFSRTNTTKIESNFILADTENALLAMLGQIEKVPYMTGINSSSSDDKLSFLQKIIKPMTTMLSMMKGMMFGSDKQSIVADPAERVLSFDEKDAMTMTVPVTNDGTKIDDFAHFKLLKMHSIYADNINSCRVKKVPGMISWTSWDDTFIEGGNISHNSPNSTILKKEVWNSDQWIDWCQKAADKKGMFDYLADWSKDGPFNPLNWMKGMLSAFVTMLKGEFEIKEISNTIQRGLVLEVQKVELDPVSKRNSTEFQIMKISRGQQK